MRAFIAAEGAPGGAPAELRGQKKSCFSFGGPHKQIMLRCRGRPQGGPPPTGPGAPSGPGGTSVELWEGAPAWRGALLLQCGVACALQRRIVGKNVMRLRVTVWSLTR
ncbi:hypothetical protein Esti_003880 [Eimeria stiedai]